MNRIIIVCNDIYRIVHSMLNWKPVRFGSARTGRVLQTQCQWPALGRNLHNFIWIVALINCPAFPFLLFSLSLCSFILSLAYCYDIQNIRFISLCACVPPSTPTLSPSLPLPVPMLSPAFDFSLIKLSASGYGFLSHYGSVLPPFFSTFFLSLSLLNVFLRFASSTALWFGSHSASFINLTMAKRKYLRIFWRALLSVAPPLSWHRQPTERTKTTCA